MSHTAAPWQITEERKGLIGVGTASSEHICEIFTHGSRPGGANRNIAEHKANAQLIVGAPDLLRAAKMALYEMRHTVATRNSFTDAVDFARCRDCEGGRCGMTNEQLAQWILDNRMSLSEYPDGTVLWNFKLSNEKIDQIVGALRANPSALLDGAQALIAEIREYGTHQSWKSLARILPEKAEART